MRCARLSLPTASLIATVGVLAALGAPLAPAPTARAETPVIYKWVDENGVAHYTTDRERIPASIRDRVTQAGGAKRGADWLESDAGPPGLSPAAPLPGVPAAATPREREAEGVELPEESDGVHAVEARPDWSEAPGGEAAWAPGDLGDEKATPAQAPVEAPPVAATATAGRAAPAPEPAIDDAALAPPPPPPPPLEADGAPVAVVPPAPEPDPAPARSAPAGREAPVDREAPVAESAPGLPAPEAAVAVGRAPEPSAPAAVAAPAPRDLAPDEAEELAKLDAQISEVEAEIARDEEALMGLISSDEATRHDALVDDPKFRDIAQRLPQLQADLERLRERRAQIQPAVSRP